MSDHDHDVEPIAARALDAAADGCEESRLLIQRRAFLGMSVGFFSWAFAPRIADAAPSADPRLLIVLLEGGMDGLHVAAPLDDPNYARLRGVLAINPADLLPLNGAFGVNRHMQNFYRMYQAGEASLVHAIAPPLRNRSHFDCMYNLQAGIPGGHTTSGWMNRLMSVLQPEHPVKIANALHVEGMPFILAGNEPILGWSPGVWSLWPGYEANVQRLYQATDAGLHRNLTNGLTVNRIAQTQSGHVFPSSPRPTNLQNAFRGAGRLMFQERGPRVSVLTVGGWDSHNGQLAFIDNSLTAFDSGLNDFRLAIGEENWKQTVVVCVTEFGRTGHINGTLGTDHGVGTVAFLAGGAVAGRKVHADWPGLAANQLDQGRDLRATYDIRQLFKGVLMEHLGVPRQLLDTQVFPESRSIAPLTGLVRPGSTRASVSRLTAAKPASAPADTPIGRFRQQAVN